MAQAARLNLRMQKELKLLITDPPPGATFPSLSSQSSSATSLSSIDAQIKGPEGSVYEKGIFKLKIQIPERYPFQPPIVTFVTPVYHPNIDTGGRICLDILNLPPKGAWQPSLNISTVLTSIGLLLSEPNPDDGLMHEASSEYKYNRQVFDQKARSMTEKFAEVGASKVEKVAQGGQTLPSSIEPVEAKGSDSSMTPIQDNSVSQKRICGVGRKLSLESSEPDQKRNDGKALNEVPSCDLYDRPGEYIGLKQESKTTLIERNKTHKDLQDSRKKLSLELLVPVQKKNADDMIDVVPFSSLSQPKFLLMDPLESKPSVQPGFGSQQTPHVNEDSQPTFDITETRLRRDIQKPLSLRKEPGEEDKKLCFVQQSAVQFSSSGSHQSPLGAPTISHPNDRFRDNVADGQGSSLPRIKHKKLGLTGRRSSKENSGWNQCPEIDNKENITPNSSFSHPQIEKNFTSYSLVSGRGKFDNNNLQISTNSSSKLSGTQQMKTSNPFVESNNKKNIKHQSEMQSEHPSRFPDMQNDSCNDKKQQPKDYEERFTAGIKKQEEASPLADAVIVLDSEESEGEQGRTKRSKLSLARRRLPGKRKSHNTNLTIKENIT